MPLTLNGTTEIVYDNLNSNITTLMQPKNWIINGGFDVWQRGTSFTDVNSVYVADRWRVYNSSGTTFTVSRGDFSYNQNVVPKNPTYYASFTQVAGTKSYANNIIQQKIENYSIFNGKTLSVSFWAKASTNGLKLGVFMFQNAQSGANESITSVWTGLGGVKTLKTSWARYTQTITLPMNTLAPSGVNNSTNLNFVTQAGSDFTSYLGTEIGLQSGTFDIANVSLVEGSVPVEWQTESYADVLRECQRYYVRFSGSNAWTTYSTGNATTTTSSTQLLSLPVDMRTEPSSVEYSTLIISDSATAYSVSGLTILNSSKKQVALNATTTGLTQFKFYTMGNNNSASGYVALTAEL